MIDSCEICAREILEVVPLVMRAIRSEMRSHRSGDLTVAQFRTLLFIQRTPGCSLSSTATFLDHSLPSTSKMVDGLVERGLVERLSSTADRRKITLTLTPHGASVADESRKATQERLAESLGGVTQEEQECIRKTMAALRQVFTVREAIEA